MFSDTAAEADQVRLELLRQAPVSRKLEMIGQLNLMAKSLALSKLRRQESNPAPFQFQPYPPGNDVQGRHFRS